jgi:hypothetical protein
MRVVVCTATVLMFLYSNAYADIEECNSAIDSYNAAVESISDTLRRYTSCVSDSRGNDDCSLEFGRLRSAHDDFESAVSSYQSDCQ